MSNGERDTQPCSMHCSDNPATARDIRDAGNIAEHNDGESRSRMYAHDLIDAIRIIVSAIPTRSES